MKILENVDILELERLERVMFGQSPFISVGLILPLTCHSTTSGPLGLVVQCQGLPNLGKSMEINGNE